jgi:hypothetical protein
MSHMKALKKNTEMLNSVETLIVYLSLLTKFTTSLQDTSILMRRNFRRVELKSLLLQERNFLIKQILSEVEMINTTIRHLSLITIVKTH